MENAERYYIGIDIGTTGSRAVIFDSRGTTVSSSGAEYPLAIPRAGWAEQDPELIFNTCLKALKDAVADFPHDKTAIRSVAISSVFHSVFPVSNEGLPLHNLLIWADSRAQKQSEEINRTLNAQSLYERTGCPLHPMYPLSKLLWFKRERPELFQQAAKFISIKEFFVHRMAGVYVVDKSIATGTGLYNAKTSSWDKECLDLLGLETSRLSEIVSTTHCLKWNTASVGLPEGIPLVMGAGDGVLSTLGAGAIGRGQFTAMIGTSGAIRLASPEPRTDWATKNWCYALTDDMWIIGGAINNGGMALRWARDKFARTEQYVAEKMDLDPYEVLGQYAKKKPAGSDGLILLPFLAGERSPYWNANARGVLFGLNLNHGKRHLIRATFEGILYSMYSVFKSLKKLSPEMSGIEVRASGSFTRSGVWVQMMADIFGCPITVPGDPEGSAFGAAVLGMLAVQDLKSIHDVSSLMGAPRAVYQPDPNNHVLYARLHEIYERVYSKLIEEFDAIASLQNELVIKNLK